MGLTGPEKKALIDEIMKDLKLQTDRKRELFVKKTVTINPQLLATTNPSSYGPYYFGTSFSKKPHLAFGQARSNGSSGLLIVQPYIDSWVVDSGGVQGFNLGVYALTTVPAGLRYHAITIIATGKATAYKSDNNSKWQKGYNANAARHLTAEDGDLEQPG